MADPHPPLVKQNIQNIEYGFIECLTHNNNQPQTPSPPIATYFIFYQILNFLDAPC